MTKALSCTISLHGVTSIHSGAYVTDPAWRVYPVTVTASGETLQIDGIHSLPFCLFAYLEVPGFGRTVVPVDGDGTGLTTTSFALAVEALRSRLAWHLVR